MHRFFVDDDPAPGALLRGAQAHQIANVLRLSPGEEIAVVRDGFESIVVLDAVSPSEVRGHVTGRRSLDTELRVALTLALPILRGDRTEEVIEAVTQLGVSRIVPYVSSRSVVRALGPAKRERWARVARESAETARRGRIPTIDDCRDWVALFDALGPGALVAWEGERERGLADAVPQGPLALVIGPEGGLAATEVALARAHGAVTVSLGPRNLRSETAAIAAVAQLVSRLERT